MFWKPTLAIQSDPASFIVKLAELTKKISFGGWLKTLREKDNAKEADNKYYSILFFRNSDVFIQFFPMKRIKTLKP